MIGGMESSFVDDRGAKNVCKPKEGRSRREWSWRRDESAEKCSVVKVVKSIINEESLVEQVADMQLR